MLGAFTAVLPHTRPFLRSVVDGRLVLCPNFQADVVADIEVPDNPPCQVAE